MNTVDRDSLMNKIGSIYKLVVLASMRAIDLGDGAAKLVDSPLGTNPLNIALKEIIEGKITYKAKPGKESK